MLRFRKRNRKCTCQPEARRSHCFFSERPKTINLVEDVDIVLTVKFRWIPFSVCTVEIEYMKNWRKTVDRRRTTCDTCNNSSVEPSAKVHYRENIWSVLLQKPLHLQRNPTRAPKGNISRSWVQWTTVVGGSARTAIFICWSAEKHKPGRWCWDLA